MAEVPAWANDYVGIPFVEKGRGMDGADCWGLFRLAQQRQFNVDIPSYLDAYESTMDGASISEMAAGALPLWTPVPKGLRRCGDGILFRMPRDRRHVGLVLNSRYMLHIESGINAAIEDYTGLRWQHRLLGFYRYGSVDG